MGMPNIPDIKPKIEISIEETIALILASIALEEISLAHIMNAEAEKIQAIVECPSTCKLKDMLIVNKSVEKTLKTIMKKEILLELKLDDVVDLMDKITDFDRVKKC